MYRLILYKVCIFHVPYIECSDDGPKLCNFIIIKRVNEVLERKNFLIVPVDLGEKGVG